MTKYTPRSPGCDRASDLRGDQALAVAQARRIANLEQRLAERTRVLTQAAQVLATEIRRREDAQSAMFEAQKLEAIGHLAGGLAHDLRNLLGTLSLGYQVLSRKSGDEDVRKVAESGGQALKQANAMIENLLDLMRHRDGQAEIIVPADWLTHIADLLRYAAGSQVSLDLRVAEGAWPVRAVEHRLGSALINLTINARDATPPTGGEILIEVANLPLGAPRPAGAPEGDFVVFAVIDSGAGMPPEVMANTGSPLYTSKASRRGTGLGLFMVRGFMRASSGHLHISSTAGEGTRVEIYLPRADAAIAPPLELPPPRPTLPAGNIMLVDEDDLSRADMAAMLRESGYRVSEANSAEVAQALLHTLPTLSLVITDVSLPGISGPLLLRNLRQERPGLPGLFISASALRSSPISDIPMLQKPVSREQLQTAVQSQRLAAQSPLEKQAMMIDRLLVRIRSPDLRIALLEWRDARGNAFLPDVTLLNRLAPQLADWTFVAASERAEGTPSFRFESVGEALVRRLGRSPGDPQVGPVDEEIVGTLASAYRRAERTGQPSYEFARYSFGTAPPVLFERLILPASTDGTHVSHLLGIVLFFNLSNNQPQGTEP